MRKEYCLKCWKEKNGNPDKMLTLSNDLGRCDICGKWKRIVMPSDGYYGERNVDGMEFIFLWYWLLQGIGYFIWRRLQWIYHYICERKKK